MIILITVLATLAVGIFIGGLATGLMFDNKTGPKVFGAAALLAAIVASASSTLLLTIPFFILLLLSAVVAYASNGA